MREGLTAISVVLDRSGSMSISREGTITGLNKFLSDQREMAGKALFTLAQFDDVYEELYSNVDINEVAERTYQNYVPRGSTALLDAIGRSIDNLGARLSALPDAERPSKVVFVIITDGAENSSREYKWRHIADKIAHQRDTYNWQFLFLGANMDAISTAAQINIGSSNTMNYHATSKGTHGVFGMASASTRAYRGGLVGQTVISDEDKAEYIDDLSLNKAEKAELRKLNKLDKDEASDTK